MFHKNFVIVFMTFLIQSHASEIKNLVVTPKLPTLPPLQLPGLLHNRLPLLPPLTLPALGNPPLLPLTLPGLPKLVVPEKVTHFPPIINPLPLKPISDDKPVPVLENSSSSVDSKITAPVNGLPEVSVVEPVSFSTHAQPNESSKMISEQIIGQKSHSDNSLLDKPEVGTLSTLPTVGVNSQIMESSSLGNGPVNISALPNLSNTLKLESSISKADSDISKTESVVSNPIPNISNSVEQSKVNDEKDISPVVTSTKIPIPRLSLKAIKSLEKQKSNSKISSLNKESSPSLLTIPKQPIKLENNENLKSDIPSSSPVKSTSVDVGPNTLEISKSTLPESSMQSIVNSVGNIEKSPSNNGESSNSESTIQSLNPAISSSSSATTLLNPPSPLGSVNSALPLLSLNPPSPLGSSNSASPLLSLNPSSFLGSSNSTLNLGSSNSVPSLPSAVLLNIPNNPVYAVPGIDTPLDLLNNSKRAIQKRLPQIVVSQPQNVPPVGYQTAGASQNSVQFSSVSNQNVEQQYLGNHPNNFQSYSNNNLPGTNQQMSSQQNSYPQLNLSSPLDLTSKLGLPLQLPGINQPLITIPNNGSFLVSLPIPQGAAPAVTSLLSPSDPSQSIFPQVVTSNQNEVPERVPCTCGVFLSGQFKRGSSAQPKGYAVIQNELSQSFPCNSAGKNQCTNKCLDAMVKHLPNSASIICGTVDRDIRKEKLDNTRRKQHLVQD